MLYQLSYASTNALKLGQSKEVSTSAIRVQQGGVSKLTLHTSNCVFYQFSGSESSTPPVECGSLNYTNCTHAQPSQSTDFSPVSGRGPGNRVVRGIAPSGPAGGGSDAP